MWMRIRAPHHRAFVLNGNLAWSDTGQNVANLEDLDVLYTDLRTSRFIDAGPFVDNSCNIS